MVNENIIRKSIAEHNIDIYNQNLNCCKYCKKTIFASYNKKLANIKRK